MAIDLSKPMSYRHFVILVTIAAKLKISTVAIGTPGLGKTSLFEAIARQLQYLCEVCEVPGKNTLSDILGGPRASKRKSKHDENVEYDVFRFAVYDWIIDLLEEENSMLLFDDLQAASPEMQQIIMGLMYRKQFGPHRLENTAMFAATNPIDGKLAMDWALCNRLFALPACFSMEEFVDLKLAGYPDPTLPIVKDSQSRYDQNSQITCSFLKKTPSFDNIDPDGKIALEEQFPSARSFEYYDKLVSALDVATYDGKLISASLSDYQRLVTYIGEGTIGTDAFAAYHTFLREKELPDAKEILANPRLALNKENALKARPDRLYLMLRVMVRHVTANLNPKTWSQAWNVLGYLEECERKSFGIVPAKILLQMRNSDLPINKTIPKYESTLKEGKGK